MTNVGTRVDPITTAVIAGALDAIAVEMGHKLARMAYSSIIRESEDFGACCATGRGASCASRPSRRRSSPDRSLVTSLASTGASVSSDSSGGPAMS
jgi:hypothetical protein